MLTEPNFPDNEARLAVGNVGGVCQPGEWHETGVLQQGGNTEGGIYCPENNQGAQYIGNYHYEQGFYFGA